MFLKFIVTHGSGACAEHLALLFDIGIGVDYNHIALEHMATAIALALS